jgi:hypothetical protein
LTLVILGMLATAAAVTALLTHQLRRASPPSNATATTDEVPLRSRTRPSPPPPSPMRMRIREAVERAVVRDDTELSQYLDSLEARARAQGKVTALEIEPGFEMIRRQSPDPDLIGRFSDRMLKVQAELNGTPPSMTPDPQAIHRELEAVLPAIGGAPDQAERQALIRKYLALAQQLDPDEQIRTIEAINATAQPRP